MASQGVAANSRLAQMQMKFQQKQLLEREQKKLALTGADGSASDTSVTSKGSIGNGKVRQMFDDRRRGVGIDRSHPLKPIATTTTTSTVTTKTSTQQPATMRRLAGGANVPRRTVITNNTTKQTTTTTTLRGINNNNHLSSNGSSNGDLFNDTFDDADILDNETFPKEFSSLSLDNTRVMGSHIIGDRFYNNNNQTDGERDVLDATITISKKVSPKPNGIKLNPVIMKKSPNTTIRTTTTTQQRTPGSGSRVTTSSKANNNNTMKSPLPKPAVPATKKTTPASKAGAAKPATFVMAVKPPPRVITPPPGMAACHYCQRNFNEDRLEKHEAVCGKMTSTKRKIFDASKHRVQGTEAEKYLKKGKGSKPASTPKPTSVVAAIKAQTQTDDGGKKSNWRKKHEEFIAAIREAKKVQAYLAKGGKLSDLPPPPPSENPDYIQCPHCSRRFNVSAAERHIPKCANMQHNKPKPPAARKRY